MNDTLVIVASIAAFLSVGALFLVTANGRRNAMTKDTPASLFGPKVELVTGSRNSTAANDFKSVLQGFGYEKATPSRASLARENPRYSVRRERAASSV